MTEKKENKTEEEIFRWKRDTYTIRLLDLGEIGWLVILILALMYLAPSSCGSSFSKDRALDRYSNCIEKLKSRDKCVDLLP